MAEQDLLGDGAGAGDSDEGRRSVLARAGRLAAAGMAGAVAALVARPTQAQAGTYTYYCCHLAKAPSSSCPTQCHYQTPTYHLNGWYCFQGTTRWYCGECTTGSDCYSGIFLCSYAMVS